MAAAAKNVLFLCTGNSARSILAEAVLNHLGRGRFTGYSAGSFPKGQVHPLALDLLRRRGLATTNLRSKSWSEFAGPGAPRMDYIFTVCDAAAGEVCPIWPGHPVTAHWGLPDPAAATGSREVCLDAFKEAYAIIEARVCALLKLRLDGLPQADVRRLLAAAGKTMPGATS